MTLAPFFNKAATAVSSVLHGLGRAELEDELHKQTIGIVFDDATAASTEGRTLLELATNLICRLFPKVAVVGGGGESSKALQEVLEALARRIHPAIDIASDVGSITFALLVGEHSPLADAIPRIHAGSNGWIAYVSSRRRLTCSESPNPFGAAAAACIAVANVFRGVFSSRLPRPDLDADLWLSVLDLVPCCENPANPPVVDVEIPPTHLVGVGAIGNAVVWALSRASFLRGSLDLIDHEPIDDTNPQRYVLAFPEHDKVAKVDLAAQTLAKAASQLVVTPIRAEWGHFLASKAGALELDLVAVAVDSARDRIAIQASLPRRILNAWTQVGDLGVSRHDFIGDGACLACLYVPAGPTRNEDDLFAEAIRLPARLRDVRKLLATHASVGGDLASEIAVAFGKPVDALAAHAHLPLRAFVPRVICGELSLRLGSGSEVIAAEVPLAFQSALAGVLLAAGVVAEAGGLPRFSGSSKTVIDLLKPFGDIINVPLRKDRSLNCICRDPDFQTAYRRRHDGDVETPLGLAHEVG